EGGHPARGLDDGQRRRGQLGVVVEGGQVPADRGGSERVDDGDRGALALHAAPVQGRQAVRGLDLAGLVTGDVVVLFAERGGGRGAAVAGVDHAGASGRLTHRL